ncbi:hypothetical protein [Kribbella sancticallisti]
MKECDDRGVDDFLATYGFGRAREYLLRYDGKTYDSKAILGVAQKYATGRAATSSSFSGGRTGAAKVLRELGFEVTYVDISAPGDVPATGTWREASEVGSDNARSAWAEAARDVLLDAANRYRSVVTYKELANHVQYRTGIRTKQLMHYWIGDVLARVAADCSRRGEPLLSSLCVNTEGSVGDGYAIAVTAAYGEAPEDSDAHAANERLACYQHFEAAGLPPDGGSPALVPRLAASRERARKAALADRPVAQCPTCHLQVPASGICDYCD